LVTLSICLPRRKREIEEKNVRFRTVGDMSCTAVDSYAANNQRGGGEIRLSTISEEEVRESTNVQKQRWRKKKQGYF
jgi:sulfate adenylyltransferase subunit 2